MTSTKIAVTTNLWNVNYLAAYWPKEITWKFANTFFRLIDPFTLIVAHTKMISILGILVMSFVTINPALSARIVGFSAISSGSHYLLIKTVMEELASRGHEVCNDILY